MSVETDNRSLQCSRSEMSSFEGPLLACSADRLIAELKERVSDLDVDGLNDRQILGSDFVGFLSSPQGQEFGDSLRHETYVRLNAAQERSKSLRKEIEDAEEELQAATIVFAFIESITCRIRHTREAALPQGDTSD